MLRCKGLPETFPRAQPGSPLVIGSMIHYMLLLNVEDISEGNASLSELSHTLNIYSGNIDVSFVLSSKGTLVCNSSSSVLVLNRTSPSLLHTFVVDTLLDFPLPFNIPVILTYTHTRKRLRASSCFSLGFNLFGVYVIVISRVGHPCPGQISSNSLADVHIISERISLKNIIQYNLHWAENKTCKLKRSS